MYAWEESAVHCRDLAKVNEQRTLLESRVSKEQEGHLRTFRIGRHGLHLLEYTVHLFSSADGQEPMLLMLLGLESCSIGSDPGQSPYWLLKFLISMPLGSS